MLPLHTFRHVQKKVYTITSPEFGKWHNKLLITVKVLYGLRSINSMWHQKFSDNLQILVFKQCKADYELWIRDCKHHYEYIAVVVDDKLFLSNDSK